MDADRQLLGNLMLARGVVDRAAEHRGDPDWLAAELEPDLSRSRIKAASSSSAAAGVACRVVSVMAWHGQWIEHHKDVAIA